ncbi:hypothetical protein OZL92_15125 [Bacillus sonorensis]|uniref:Uncharacterized protein n=3 Tax=Bacillus sonorensis TaxID=119858 RepID=M5PBA6_9BACI|nr:MULTISPECIES: hypothetical protein [Bacillus]TWK73832.1 hypothetical protein CHCC20335_2117 [Bacillus paralicheniformis]ASB91141.1 hypothetical protein S101395_04653 [Bacillus sonorensis]EME72815.1 hypothetical protein BSONL12_21150 [Bacillus sonorensis L12]MCF7619931.1 hypothetical protein [Bacillus sonorensis]MCY7857044.1 hypothetical protein [Bacillus sonorensis]
MAEDPYTIDRSKVRYKTDPSGHFQARYIYCNETDETDRIHISVLIEGRPKPAQTFQLTVPPRSSETIHISLHIPSGSHIVYIISQTYMFDETDKEDINRHWNADYAAAYYFEIASNSAAADQQAAPLLLEPVHHKTITEERERPIYLSDREGNRVANIVHEDMYLSFINEETCKLKGYLYHFQNGAFREFQMNHHSAGACIVELKPESVQTYRISLNSQQSGCFRFLATSILPARADQDIPFPPRMFSYSGLYTFG